MKKFSVCMRDRYTGKKLCIIALGTDVDDATHKLAASLFGINGQYVWTGSGPCCEVTK